MLLNVPFIAPSSNYLEDFQLCNVGAAKHLQHALTEARNMHVAR